MVGWNLAWLRKEKKAQEQAWDRPRKQTVYDPDTKEGKPNTVSKSQPNILYLDGLLHCGPAISRIF